MKLFPSEGWLLKLFEKHKRFISLLFYSLICLLVLGYLLYFIKFGYEFSETSKYADSRTILYGILFTILIIIGFFIVHFSGGFDFNLKWLCLPIGLAVGGSSIGLIAGLQHGIWGWIVGFFTGVPIIVFTIKLIPFLKK